MRFDSHSPRQDTQMHFSVDFCSDVSCTGLCLSPPARYGKWKATTLLLRWARLTAGRLHLLHTISVIRSQHPLREKKIALSIIAEVWLRHKLCDLHKQQLNASAQILRPLTLAVPTILNNQLVRWRDSRGNVACLAFLHKSNTSVRVANKPLLNGW